MELQSEIPLLISTNRLDSALALLRAGLEKLTPSDNHMLDRLVER